MKENIQLSDELRAAVKAIKKGHFAKSIPCGQECQSRAVVFILRHWPLYLRAFGKGLLGKGGYQANQRPIAQGIAWNEGLRRIFIEKYETIL